MEANWSVQNTDPKKDTLLGGLPGHEKLGGYWCGREVSQAEMARFLLFPCGICTSTSGRNNVSDGLLGGYKLE